MMNDTSTPVTRDLDSKKVPYRVFKHPGELRSLEQAARERNQEHDQIIRSILFRTGKNQYTMVLMPGPHRISWPRLRKYIGKSRITMASEDEVRQVTGYPLGAVSPFGIPTDIQVLIDQSLLTKTEISIGSGVRGTAVILTVDDLLTALGNYQVGEFTEE
jgi:Cys-tRNA(Pro)/Cys-tRNA(Cys) deacylase